MIVVKDAKIVESKKLAATVGFFDGVHLGHRFLVEELKQIACQEGLRSAVITFPEHPRAVLHAAHVMLRQSRRAKGYTSKRRIPVPRIPCFSQSRRPCYGRGTCSQSAGFLKRSRLDVLTSPGMPRLPWRATHWQDGACRRRIRRGDCGW